MLPGCLGRNKSAKIEGLCGVGMNYVFLTDNSLAAITVNYCDQYG